MKIKLAFIISTLLLGWTMTSCDKVENPFPPTINVDLDTTYYDGVWSDYVANEWPDFSTVTNDDPNRNAIIEDFTGHNCPNCPDAADDAHAMHEANPSRVYIASIHAGASPTGTGSFQDVTSAYTIDFTNTEGKALGAFFNGNSGGNFVGSGFIGNPSGSVNRLPYFTEYFYGSGVWQTQSDAITGSTLPVAIKAVVNFYDQNKGGYLHTEVEVLDNISDDLGMVVYMIEDSVVGPQNVFNTFTPDYVHRDVMRGTLTGAEWGRTLTAEYLTDGKYYLDYSFTVPDQLAPNGQSGGYNAGNMHLLIYVYNKSTYEIYQVIKKKFL